MTAQERPLSVKPDDLREAVRRAAKRVPLHMIADEAVRELCQGRPVDEVQISEKARILGERAVAKRRAMGR